MYSIMSILKYVLCPDKNFDNVALDIPAIVLSFETFKFLSSIKFVILILIACDKSTLKLLFNSIPYVKNFNKKDILCR